MAHTVSEEDLCDEFSMFGIELEDSSIIERLQELCTMYRLDAADLVNQWVAFRSSHSNAELTPMMMDPFERETLSKSVKKSQVKKEKMPEIYSVEDLADGPDVEGAEELFSMYGGSTPSAKNRPPSNKRQLTPESGPIKKFMGSTRSPVAPFSPASFSPASATPSKKYNSRTNKGEVVCGVGAVQNTRWQGQGQGQPCTITTYSSEQTVSKAFKYMFQKLSEKFRVLDDLIEDMGEHLKKTHNIEEYAHVALPTQDEVTVVGRVCCDSQGKMNAKSVILEGSVDMSAGKTIPVDLTQLKEYALFPGQVVAMDGYNSTGQKFVAKKVYESVNLPLPEVPSSSEPVSTRLSVLVAAGPYSTSDSLSCEPLSDLLQQIQQTPPDVCILMGPFVDSKNAENGKLTVTYEQCFRQKMENIAKVTERLNCQVIVLPSARDLHHDLVYPQPPYHMEGFQYKHVHFMQDPCTVSINNIVFGLTSTDVLFQLGAEEIAFPPGSSDRLGRLTQHLLAQHSYYPLYPANEETCIDYELYQTYAVMPVTPHILILPSEFKQFIKDLKGCCCINPGRLTKGLTGSTFARIVVQVNNLTSNQSVVPNITAKVVRI